MDFRTPIGHSAHTPPIGQTTPGQGLACCSYSAWPVNRTCFAILGLHSMVVSVLCSTSQAWICAPPQSCPNCFPIFCRRHLPATPLVECRRFHQTSCDFSMLVVHRGRRSSACYTPICSHLGPLALAARSARWVDCDPISCLRQLRHQPRHHATASRCLRASRDCNHCGVGDGLRCVRAIHPGVAALRCGRA